jgi:hypothetical protein
LRGILFPLLELVYGFLALADLRLKVTQEGAKSGNFGHCQQGRLAGEFSGAILGNQTTDNGLGAVVYLPLEGADQSCRLFACGD